MKTDQEVVPVPSYKSFEVLIPRYFREEVGGLSPNTIIAKRNDLKLFLGCFASLNGSLLPADHWLPRDTRAFVQELSRQEYAPASINRCLATLRSFAAWLQEKQVIGLDPCKGIRDLELAPLAPRAIRDREWYRIQKTADVMALTPLKQYSQGYRNRAILAALNSSGLRIGELLGLKLDQLVGRKFLRVHCKGSRVRDVLISKEAAELIGEYVREHRVSGKSDLLFVNRFGTHLSRNGIAYAFNRIAAQASIGLADDMLLRPHEIRHRHCYQARKAHGDVFAAKRLGHASLQHLERYSMMTDEEEADLLEKM